MNRDKAISLLTSAKAQSYIDQVETVVKGVPNLPKVVTDILVSITPWLVIISGILSAVNGLQFILYAFGVQNIAVTAGISPMYWLLMGAQHLVSAYLSVLAFQLLRDHKYTGWVLLFWNMATAVFASVVSLLFIPGSLIPSLFAIALGIYLTFEIKSYYTGEAKVAALVAPELDLSTQTKSAATAKRTTKAKKSTKKK